MVNLVVRHSSHHMHQSTGISKPGNNLTNTVRNTKGTGYDPTIPSPIRIPSRQNTRAVSPLTTSESLFGGAPVPAGGGGAGGGVGFGSGVAVAGGPANNHHPSGNTGSGPLGVSSPRRHEEIIDDRYGNVEAGDQQHHGLYANTSTTPTSHMTRGRDPSPRKGSTSNHTNNNNKHLLSATSNDAFIVGAGDPECDYDSNVTSLYELLESSEWEQARHRSRTHPKETKTWIVRRDGKSNKVRWKLLPLHAAVIFQAPTGVVSTLLDQYPLAAAKRDDQGMLPLHLAFRHHQQKDETLLKLLLEQYPKGVMMKDRRDRFPLDHGKETQFSAQLMAMYANAHSRCGSSSTTPSLDGSNNNDENKNKMNSNHKTIAAAATSAALAKAAADAAAAEREILSTHYDSQLGNLKAMFEERIATLASDHRAALEQVRHQAEEDQRVALTRHTQEMDELRDLLAREVSGGQRARELEIRVEELKASLHQSNRDVEHLRSLVRDHKAHSSEMKDQVRKIIADQQTLYEFCTQQQEQLEQAHDMREQMLRSLLQKESESHKTSRVLSLELGQVADNIRLRAEKLLSTANRGTGVGGGMGGSAGRGGGAGGNSADTPTEDAAVDDMDVDNTNSRGGSGGGAVGVPQGKDRTNRNTGRGVEESNQVAKRHQGGDDGVGDDWRDHHHHHHDDDISAITEGSHF